MTQAPLAEAEQIPEQALAWHRAGTGAALATVIETWGSAPRRIGSQLAISGDGQIQGSVSGGCVEGAVIVDAMEAITEGDARELEFGVSDDDAFAVGLACGGTIRVLVEPVGSVITEELLSELCTARAAREAVAVVTDLATGQRHLTRTGHAERFAADRSGFLDGERTFITIHNPPLRCLVVGAVHIAQALAPMLRATGFDATIVDPRETFASAARFPGMSLSHDWPAEAAETMGLDARTAIILLTHDPKLDDPVLELALAQGTLYLGALGSKRTHAKRTERLRAKGFTDAQIAQIKGPIGLDIGASNPAEIAVSIMGELIQTLRKGTP